MNEVLITPQDGMTLLSFLEKHATAVPTNAISDVDWSSFPEDSLPIFYLSTPTGKYGRVLLNEQQWKRLVAEDVDGINSNSTRLEKGLFWARIDVLWDNSNIGEWEEVIDRKKVHKRMPDRGRHEMQKNDMLQKIATELNQTKTVEVLADECGVTKNNINYHAKMLRENGVLVPLARKGVNYKVFISNLMITRPDLIDKKLATEKIGTLPEGPADKPAPKRGPYKKHH